MRSVRKAMALRRTGGGIDPCPCEALIEGMELLGREGRVLKLLQMLGGNGNLK